MSDLFSDNRLAIEEIYPDVFVLANFTSTTQLLKAIEPIIQHSPFQKMLTPNGYQTNVALTNCGDYGWVSDINGYRYSAISPTTGKPWPKIPDILSEVAQKAASQVGYHQFTPDACLINYYTIGTKLGSHQDKNEKDFSQPIVSISIGLPAIFQIFGHQRSGIPVNYQLFDGDVMVWGKESRLIYHGVKAIKADLHQPDLKQRINITLRKAS